MVLVTPRNFCTVSITLAGSVRSSLPSKTRIWKEEKEVTWTGFPPGGRQGQQPEQQEGAWHHMVFSRVSFLLYLTGRDLCPTLHAAV